MSEKKGLCKHWTGFAGETVVVDGRRYGVHKCGLHGKCVFDVAAGSGYTPCPCELWKARDEDTEADAALRDAQRRRPPGAGEERATTKRGVGDLVGEFLATLSVTPESYVAAKEKVGLPPSCRCEKRKAWLNKLGEQVGVGEIADRLARWIKTRRAAVG